MWTAVGSIAAIASVLLVVMEVGSPGPVVSSAPPAGTPAPTVVLPAPAPPASDYRPPQAGGQAPAAAPRPAPFQATIWLTSGGTARVFAAPSLSSPIVTELPPGTLVFIYCTVRGESVTNNGTTSTLWDRIDDGYVPDVNVRTGTDQPVRPSC
jgi:hypothetical protein